MPHLFKINLQRIKYLNVISGTQELIRKVQGKDFKIKTQSRRFSERQLERKIPTIDMGWHEIQQPLSSKRNNQLKRQPAERERRFAVYS